MRGKNFRLPQTLECRRLTATVCVDVRVYCETPTAAAVLDDKRGQTTTTGGLLLSLSPAYLSSESTG